MVIVVTSVVVGGAALVTDPGFGSALPRTSIDCTRLLIVFLIIAARSRRPSHRSTMSAVLSLGAVGYGVALMFLIFGAPDLAMTQFSVETLTVLIYVLVFGTSANSVRCRRGSFATATR